MCVVTGIESTLCPAGRDHGVRCVVDTEFEEEKSNLTVMIAQVVESDNAF